MTRPLAVKSLVVIAAATALAVMPAQATEARSRLSAEQQARAAITDARLAELGLRKLVGKHLTLVTDAAANPEIDALPRLFDQAIPQWCEYLHVSPQRAADWQVTGYLMRDKQPFEAAGLLGEQVPAFDHGFSFDHEFWLREQPSDYYRRHLLLHEATHSFMNTLLGSCGPTWYMEGIAELLATHRLEEGKLTLGYFPRQENELLLWGRIKLVQDRAAEGQILSIDEVLELRPGGDRTNVSYSWCWALAALLDGDPRYHERFRQLPVFVADKNFDQRFRELFDAEWDSLAFAWQLFIAELDYGYDFQRMRIDGAPSIKAADGENQWRMTLASDRGWQTAGIPIEAGVSYRIEASGQFELNPGPPPWICEPDGISIHYHHGQPLGRLLAAIKPDEAGADRAYSFLHPVEVGRQRQIRSSRGGVLYLKINDSAGKLSDNRGTVTIDVTRL